MTYHPDAWSVVKVNGDKPHYRVLASWHGSYLGGESWRMNSGITHVTQDDKYFFFHGASGSVYCCQKIRYGASFYALSVLEKMSKEQPELNLELMPKDMDFMAIKEDK